MKYRLLVSITLLIYSCSDTNEIPTDDCQPFNFTDTYEYPLSPETDKWKELTSHNEMVEVCQIPDKTLNEISTEGLVESMLNYPLIFDYFAFDNLQDGFENLMCDLDGLKELYSRTNLFETFKERYDLMTVDCKKNPYPPFSYNSTTPISFSFITFELFLFQNEFLDSIDYEDRKQIFELVYEKLLLKEEQDFSNASKLPSYAILGTLMYKNSYSPFIAACQKSEYLKFFITRIPAYYPESYNRLDTIKSYSQKYKASW